MEYLDFELPIKDLQEQYTKACKIGEESDVDVTNTCKQIEQKLQETKKEIYKNLTPWQRVQLSRHPDRPYTMDYINAICGTLNSLANAFKFLEIVEISCSRFPPFLPPPAVIN